jgi:hypothetical protein
MKALSDRKKVAELEKVLEGLVRRGDPEDIACWRAAELRQQGKRATVAVRVEPGRYLTCVVVTDEGEERPEDIVLLRPKHAGRARKA